MTESTTPTRPVWQTWAPEAVAATVVLVLGLLEAQRSFYGSDLGHRSLVAFGIAAAVLMARRLPGPALALVWVLGAFQVLTDTPVLSIELAVAVVAFGCARWGHPVTVVASGLSIPAAAGIVALLAIGGSYRFFEGIGVFRDLIDSAYRFSDTLLVGATILGMLVLALPWLAGLVIRATLRARGSKLDLAAAEEGTASAQRDAAQAQEIARLREEQAHLARDVHDVVGHSLAVILAQAESAQYQGDDPAQLKSTLATIATSARGSLQDVRQVLSATHQAMPASPQGSEVLDTLVDGIRASGQEVRVDEVGVPRPLPPELEVVAHRVLQEMLTNAVKHGARAHPIHVERHWPGGEVAGFERDLRVEVRNTEAPRPDDADPRPLSADPLRGAGQGLTGMKRRLESVGGRIDVRRRETLDGVTFTATAWVPVRRA
ncbi:MAG: histidine kinase [Nocardioidaceae bacterium]